MEAEMSELRAELGGEDAAESATTEAESVEGDPEADTASEDEESEEKDEPAETLEDERGETARAEVAKLFAEGNLKGACEKLGLDPTIFKVNNRQFAAARKAESEAKRLDAAAAAREAAAAAKLAESESLRTGAEKVYGPIVAGNKAYRVDRDMNKAKAAVELLFEDTWENIQAAIAKGSVALSPAELQVAQLRKELEDERAAKAADGASAAAAQQHAKDVEAVTGRLASTPLAGVEGAAEEIVKVIRASYNPALKKNTKTLKEAYAEVKAGLAKKAAQLAKLTGAKPSATPEPERPAKRGAVRKPIAGDRKPAQGVALTEEQKMEAEMAAARKEFDAEQRRAARGRK
jgi:hypothetical protein